MINNNEPKELVVQTSQNVLIDTLPDGSVITLNKRSTITYPSKFKGNTRAIALKVKPSLMWRRIRKNHLSFQ
jgi:hypothetical protein